MGHTLQHRVDHFKSLVDFLSDFGTSQDNLAAHENQEYNLGLDHSVDQTGEQLGLVRAEVVMARSQTLQADRELDVARANDVLDLEIRELCVEAELLYNTSVFAASKLRVIFRLSTSHDHLARGEDQSGRLGLSNSHNDGSETLCRSANSAHGMIQVMCLESQLYLWVVFSIPCVQGNRLQVQAAIQVDRGNDVSLQCEVSPWPYNSAKSNSGGYILQGGRQPTSTLRRSWRRSRGGGSHPGTVGLLRRTIHGPLTVGFIRSVDVGRCEIPSAAGEGQGTGCSKSLCLCGSGGVGLKTIHDEPSLVVFPLKIDWVGYTTDL